MVQVMCIESVRLFENGFAGLYRAGRIYHEPRLVERWPGFFRLVTPAEEEPEAAAGSEEEQREGEE